eukprot:TRINITY_DN5019_c0_g2_i1.p1 TRINITY_DN5019_c0_g2~~TRINITY_DN5019_c0_g2_i1.p1  ORF type:complete len:495 (-),score=45.12 TRINITY_DN5019_c0_g2_i1:1476-2960(-)
MLRICATAIPRAGKGCKPIRNSTVLCERFLRSKRSQCRLFSALPDIDPSSTSGLSEKAPRPPCYGKLVKEEKQLRFPFAGRKEEAALFLDGFGPDDPDGLLAQWRYTLNHWLRKPTDEQDKQRRAIFACAGGPGYGKSRMLQDLLQEEVIPLVDERLASLGITADERSSLKTLSESLHRRLISVFVTFGNGSVTPVDAHLGIAQRLTLRVQHALSGESTSYSDWANRHVNNPIPELIDVISQAVDDHVARNLIDKCSPEEPVIFHLCIDEFNAVELHLNQLVQGLLRALLVRAARPVFFLPFLGGLLRHELAVAVSKSTARCVTILPRLARVEASYDAFRHLPEYKDHVDSFDPLRKCIAFFGGHWRSLEHLDRVLMNHLALGCTMKTMPWTKVVHAVQVLSERSYAWTIADRLALLRDIVWRYRSPAVSDTQYFLLDALGIIQINRWRLLHLASSKCFSKVPDAPAAFRGFSPQKRKSTLRRAGKSLLPNLRR